MALISCPECGKQISDRAKACPHCGHPMRIEARLPAEKKADNTGKATIHWKNHKLLWICLIVVIIVIVYIVITAGIKEARYNWAVNWVNNGEFSQAIPALKNLGSYKDANILLLEAEQKEVYTQAEKLASEKSYKEAINLYLSIIDYEDSGECLREAKYFYAEQLVQQSNYDEAITIYKELGEYLDSPEKMKNTIQLNLYEEANTKVKLGDLIGAIELYQQLGDFKDCQNKIADIEPMSVFQGTWQNTSSILNDRFRVFDFQRNIVCWVVIQTTGQQVEKRDIPIKNFENGVITDVLDTKYWIEEGRLAEDFGGKNNSISTYEKISDFDVWGSYKAYEPTIGMTKAEVEGSTWGIPEDKNITTTTYGTREQWVYSGYRYVYFDDGIVTAIQE